MIETGIIITVLLPLITGGALLADYIYSRYLLERFVDKFVAVDVNQNYSLGSGQQDFFYKFINDNRTEDLLNKINYEFQQSLNRHFNAPYRIDFARVKFNVCKADGTTYDNSEDAENVRVCYETTAPGRKPYKINFLHAGDRSHDSLYNQYDISDKIDVYFASHKVLPFALPTALRGTRLQADYGVSNVYEDWEHNGTRTTNTAISDPKYRRSAVAYALNITVNLTDSSLGRIMESTGLIEGPLVLNDFRIISAGVDL